jgi:hypothetical protein
MKPTHADLDKIWPAHTQSSDTVPPAAHHGDLRKRIFLSRRAAYRSRNASRRPG